MWSNPSGQTFRIRVEYDISHVIQTGVAGSPDESPYHAVEVSLPLARWHENRGAVDKEQLAVVQQELTLGSSFRSSFPRKHDMLSIFNRTAGQQ